MPIPVELAIGLCCLLFFLWLWEKWRALKLRSRMLELAREQFEQWRQAELGGLREQERQVAHREAQTQLASWRQSSEGAIRQDAISRSQAVVTGKVSEHLAPYLGDFPYNPKDVRFIGSPVDLIIFDGLDEGRVRGVVLVEIKTGSSSVSARQRQVREAVREHRVSWLELRL